MHVSVWDADEAGGNAAAAELHGVRVGSGASWRTFHLVGDALFLRDGDQLFCDYRIDIRSAVENGTGVEFEMAISLFVAIGVVGGMGYVDGYADVRVAFVGACGSTAKSYFFLYGSNAVHGAVDFPFGD